MPLDSSASADPIDLAFPHEAAASDAPFTGDPIDEAFKDKEKKQTESSDPLGLRYAASGAKALFPGAVSTAKSMVGAAESAVSGATAGAGSLADALTGSEPGTHDWGYRPRTSTGKLIQAETGDVAKHVGNTLYNELGAPVVKAAGGDVEAARETLAQYAPEALGAVGTVAGLGGLVKGGISKPGAVVADTTAARAQSAADRAVSSQAQGASPVPINVAELTPKTQAELARMHSQGIPVDADALARIHDAETLPKGDAGAVRLTEAEAKGDVQAKSEEFNNKGKNPEIGERKAANDNAMHGSLDEMRRETSPGTVANTPEQNSQVLIDKLKGIGDTRDAAITSAYNDAKALNGGKVDMAGGDYVARANKALDEGNAGDFLPADVRKAVVDKFAKNGGQMTLDDFLSARKTLGNAQRELEQSGQGNALHAVNVVRDQLEATKPTAGLGTDAKAAFDKASALAKSNFDDIKTNPAYKAAYNDRSITPTGETSDLNKNFTQKHVLGGTQANLQRLRSMFKGDDEANQTMTGVALNRLKEVSGNGEGEFRAKAYRDSYRKEIQPRAKELLGGDQGLQDNLEKLDRVAGNIKAKDASDFSNYSHTNVAQRAVQAGIGLGRAGIKHVVPYGDKLDAGINWVTDGNRVKTILKPGAGLAQ